MATLLRKYLDADQWETEDVVGRLGMVAHAAFLFGGFLPYRPQPPSGYLLKQPGESKGSRCLSRRYTAPQLAHREDSDAAVLMLFAQGSHVALLVYLTTDDVGDVRSAYRERLDGAALTPLLSRAIDDTEPWGSRACQSLGNGVCWRFLDELCRGNGLQPLTGFTSLPDDAKVEILKRITDGVDLAKVECTTRQLRSLVADRDSELWKPLRIVEPFGELHGYGAVVDAGRSVLVSWKKYAKTRHVSRILILLLDSFPLEALLKIKGKPMESPVRPASLSGLEPETVARGRSAECQHHRNVPRNHKKKPQAGAGPVRLPRSRYRWKHR